MVDAGRTSLLVARSELILGGQKSGKSRRGEALAQAWLADRPGHRAVLIATATPDDAEMRERISRHQRDRAQQLPDLVTVEEPLELALALRVHSRPDTLVVVDCLTLWLTNLVWPGHASAATAPTAATASTAPTAATASPAPTTATASPDLTTATSMLLESIAAARGPIVLVSNEIGLGVIPMGREVRDFADALGQLNQQIARVCERVTWMAAGLPLVLKAAP